MVEIKQQLVSDELAKKVTFGGVNKRETITTHQTGNPNVGANAQVHADLQSRGNPRLASWMYQSDDKEIIQSFKRTAQTFHAGDGNGDGNKHSISWEICINEGSDYLEAIKLAAKGQAQVMKEEGLTVADMRQHHDWSGKNCPQQIREGKEGVTWDKFKDMVQAELDGKPVAPQTIKPAPKVTGGSVVNYMSSKGMDSSYKNRAKLAKQYGINNYKGTASQNIELLNKLKTGEVVQPKPTPQASGKSYKENGTFYPNDTIIVRDQPSTNGKIIARYYKGEKVTYHTVHLKNGYVWLQYNRSNGKQGYIPCRTYNNGKYGTLWGTIK